MLGKIKNYYRLTKPGVLYGNLLTTIAGFLLASQGNLNIGLFIATVSGTALIIGSACVINNYLDQDIDSIMERTKSRPLISGEVSSKGALLFGIILGIIGGAILYFFTSLLVLVIGIIGFITYVWLYGATSKRQSMHGTLVGSISGAMPILAGYVAPSSQLSIGALVVFLILFLWQMPEFYSISIFRVKEYKAANVPVISVILGVEKTIIQIFIYTILCVISILALTLIGVTGIIYFTAMLALGFYWINIGLEGLTAKDSNLWSRRMFRFSLIILLAFSFLISIDNLLV